MAWFTITDCSRQPWFLTRSLLSGSHPPAAVSLAANGSQLWPSLENFPVPMGATSPEKTWEVTFSLLGGLQPLTDWYGGKKVSSRIKKEWPSGALPIVCSLWNQATADFCNHIFVQLLPLPCPASFTPPWIFPEFTLSINHLYENPYLSLCF